ncbi:MAG: metallophosphoesterase [Ilumatobacteraceae bacterium]
MVYSPDARPTSLGELRFEQRPSVRWFSPGVLARSGMKVVLSNAFGDYLDKRELQNAFAAGLTRDLHSAGGLWIDYVADSGDGFDPTYTVAWALSQRHLTVADAFGGSVDGAGGDGAGGADGGQLVLPRGRILVLGGDEVYPVAKVDDYHNRFVGPFKAALPWTEPPDHPDLLAIPGNHDWYDGLTGFMRVFGQVGWIGGRRTAQARSYFAVALPGRWWLWGIDIQSDSYIDAAQIRYFRNIGESMAEGDRLILCTAKPSWTDVDEPDAYRNLGYVERHLVPPHCEAVLMISGDSHHYARYRADDGREKITSGGGGAFLSATHHLAHTADVPTTTTPGTETSMHTLKRRYPDAAASRRLSWRALGLPFRNPSFMWVPGILQVLLFMSNQFGLRSVQAGSADFEAAARGWTWFELALGRLRNPSTLLVVLTLFALLAAFAKPPPTVRARWARLIVRLVMGAIHTALHLATAASVAWVATRTVDFADGFWYVALVVVFIAVVGAVCGSIALGLYLILAQALVGSHSNEVFSAIRVEGYKNFLRIHVEPDGRLTVYALGIDRVVKDWELDPDNPDSEAPYLKPLGDRKIDVRLIDTTAFDPSPTLPA